MPFEVQCCPVWSAFSARFEPLGEMLAPAARTLAQERLAGTERASANVRALEKTVSTAYDDGVSHGDQSFLLQDYIADLPFSVLSALAQTSEAQSWIPYSAVSGMISAAVARAS